MRIDGDVSRVGIGTNAPDSTLHIRGSSNPTVRIQEDSQTGYLDLSGLQDSQASIAAVNDTASEVSILDITAKCNSSTGTGQEVRVFRDARTSADGTFTLKQPGTNTNAWLSLVAIKMEQTMSLLLMVTLKSVEHLHLRLL